MQGQTINNVFQFMYAKYKEVTDPTKIFKFSKILIQLKISENQNQIEELEHSATILLNEQLKSLLQTQNQFQKYLMNQIQRELVGDQPIQQNDQIFSELNVIHQQIYPYQLSIFRAHFLLQFLRQLKKQLKQETISIIQEAFHTHIKLHQNKTQIEKFLGVHVYSILLKSLVTSLKLLPTVECIIEMLNVYVSLDGIISSIIAPIYDSVLNVNDITELLCKQVEEQQVGIFTSLSIWKGKAKSEVYLHVMTQISNLFRLTSLSQKLTDSRYHYSQKFIAAELYKIRQIILSWLVEAFTQKEDLRQKFSIIFEEIFISNQCHFNPDFALTDPEYIKIISFTYRNINPKEHQIFQTERFWDCLDSSFHNFGDLTNSKICVHLLTTLLTSISEYCKKQYSKNQSVLIENYISSYRLFADLFITLDSFGAHITKGVWTKADSFLQEEQPFKKINEEILEDLKILSLLGKLKPFEILISKSYNHKNEKTVKNCIKQLFKKKVNVLYLEHILFDQIVPILNDGLFYTDAPLETDSKFYDIICQFFVTNLMHIDDRDYCRLVQKLIQNVLNHIKYQHSKAAFFRLFCLLDRPTLALDLQLFNKLIDYLNKEYVNVNVRKRIQVLNGSLSLLYRHTDWSNITAHNFVQFIAVINQECFKWKRYGEDFADIEQFNHKHFDEMLGFREKLWGLAKRYLQQLPAIIEQLKHQHNEDTQKSLAQGFNSLRTLISFFIVQQEDVECLQFVNLFADCFSKLSHIYSSSYQSEDYVSSCLLSLELVLEKTLPYIALKDLQVVYRALDGISSELFAFFKAQLSKQILPEQYILCIEQIFEVALDIKLFQPANNLSNQMSQFVGFLFKEWFCQLEAKNIISLTTYFNVLTVFTKVSYCKLLEAKQSGIGSFFVEELLIKYGLEILKKYTGFQNQRTVQNAYYHYLCRILPFFREMGCQNEDYQEQIKNLISNVADITDSFNCYDAYPLLIMLKNVYIPEICNIAATNTEEVCSTFKSVSLNLFNTMIAVFKTNIQPREITALIDFILDSHLFVNKDLLNTASEIIVEILKHKQWVLWRRVANNIVKGCNLHPSALFPLRKIIKMLLKENEPRGFDTSLLMYDQEQQIPYANNVKSKFEVKSEFFGIYPRMLIFSLFDSIATRAMANCSESEEWRGVYKDLVEIIFDLVQHMQKSSFKGGYLLYTKYFRVRLHYWQLICSIKKLFREKSFKATYQNDWEGTLKKFETLVWGAFEQQNHPSVRQYMEIVILNLMIYYPNLWGNQILRSFGDNRIKPNILIPINFIGNFYMISQPQSELSSKLFPKIFPMVCSNIAYIRSLCQTCCLKYILENGELLDNLVIKEFVTFFESNNECKKIIKNIDVILQRYRNLINEFDLEGIQALQMDTFGEIIHPSILETLKSTVIETIAEIKVEDELKEVTKIPCWVSYVERELQQETSIQANDALNFQRKIDFIVDSFSMFSAFRPRSIVGDMILVSSLLEKLPNIAHLTRTSEIFGVRELVVPNRKILEDEQYLAVSVTAERHIPILEVREDQLAQFLLLKKSQGYKLIGLEQTSQSKGIYNFTFPEKCVLMLGNEKTGMPLELIEMMDACVEIPQYGVIRSLNVHISAVICIWEYVKQIMNK